MTGLLDSPHVKALAREESVRGVLVRMALSQAEQADSRDKALLEKALQLLLERFQSREEASP